MGDGSQRLARDFFGFSSNLFAATSLTPVTVTF